MSETKAKHTPQNVSSWQQLAESTWGGSGGERERGGWGAALTLPRTGSRVALGRDEGGEGTSAGCLQTHLSQRH